MCGRFTLTVSGQVLADLFNTDTVPELQPRYNVAPTQVIPVLRRAADGELVWTAARWGLVPAWAKDAKAGARLINARSETAAGKPAFRTAMKKRRCLIPADGFYEWKKQGSAKQPHYIRFVDHRVFTFAGLWEIWQQPDQAWLNSFTILTTSPNPVVGAIHDRMPVILPKHSRDRWLKPGVLAPDELDELLVAHPASEMQAYPVDHRVGSPHNDDPDLIEPLSEQGSLF